MKKVAYIGTKGCTLCIILWLAKEYISLVFKGGKKCSIQLYWMVCSFSPVKNGKINILLVPKNNLMLAGFVQLYLRFLFSVKL